MIPDSDAHRAGLQEGDQVLAVNDVDFQDIEHSKVSLARGLRSCKKPSRDRFDKISLICHSMRKPSLLGKSTGGEQLSVT